MDGENWHLENVTSVMFCLLLILVGIRIEWKITLSNHMIVRALLFNRFFQFIGSFVLEMSLNFLHYYAITIIKTFFKGGLR